MANWLLEIENPTTLIYESYTNAILQQCKIKNAKDSDFKVFRYKIEGNIIFCGADFTILKGFKITNDNVNARVSNNYITLDCKLSLLNKWFESQKVCELNIDVIDEYDDLVKNKEVEFNFLSGSIKYNVHCNYPVTPITYGTFRDFNDMLLDLFVAADSTITTITDLTGFLSSIFIASISDIILNDDLTPKTNAATICNITLIKLTRFLQDIFHIYWYKSGVTIYFYYDNSSIDVGSDNPDLSAWEPLNDYSIANEKKYGRIKRDLLAYEQNHIGSDVIFENSNNNEVEKINNKDFSTDIQGSFYNKGFFPSDTINQAMLVKSDYNNVSYATFGDLYNPAIYEDYVIGFDEATYDNNIITLTKNILEGGTVYASIWVGPFDQPSGSIILEFDYSIVGEAGMNMYYYNDGITYNFYTLPGNSGHIKYTIGNSITSIGFYIAFGDQSINTVPKTITITNLKISVLSAYLTQDGIGHMNNKLSTYYIDSLLTIRNWYYKTAKINGINKTGLLTESDKELEIQFPLKDITEINPYKPINIGISTEADIVSFEQELNNYNDKVRMKVRY